MSKTRTLVVAAVAALAMALPAAAAAAPRDAGVVPDASTTELTELSAQPKVPPCKRPDCYYA
jgi:hypothetical protein